MNDSAWTAFLDTITPQERALAQSIMARVQTILNSDRNKVFDRLQHADQRSDHNAYRISDLDHRLDAYEEQQAKHVAAELERFAKEQLSSDALEAIHNVLYNISTRLEQLERQVGDAE